MKIQDKQAQKVGFKKDENGYLRATVNLGRVGSMEYMGSEIGDVSKDIDPNKVYQVHTMADQLFSPKTVASFQGAPITIQHPDSMEVNSSNWREVSVGHIENVKPNADGEHLQGDMVINDPDAIKKVENGLREVSLGYDADLSEKDGIISKVNIKGNHLAVVDEGRCGDSCKINDKKGVIMSALEKLRKKFGVSKTQPKTKMGDARAKLVARKKKLGDANEALVQAFKDAEAIVANPDATDEEKLQAVQQLQEQAATSQQEAQEALSDATDATEQAQQLAEQVKPQDPQDPSATNDDDMVSQAADEAQQKIDDLQNQLTEANAKIADLESQLAAQNETNDKKTVANDCKSVFPKMQFTDSATSKDMKRQVLVAIGSHTKETVKKLNDCALDSAYHTALVATRARSVKANQVGKTLTDSANAKSKKTAQQRMGGK